MRANDERGIVGANLVIVLAFALYAVIQLSRTTLAAKQIDDRVNIITAEVGPGSSGVSHLDEVARLDETGRIAEDIDKAAKPLSNQAGEVITAAKSIDNTVSSILSTAGSINSVVKSINGNATAINATVHGIGGTVGSLLPVVRSINNGVAAINGRADVAIPIVRGIQEDLNNVLKEVGVAGPGGHNGTIHGHANSISCSAAVAHAGSFCNQ